MFSDCRGCQEIGCSDAVRASRRARWALLSMRKVFDGIEKFPHPEEAAKRPSRRAHGVNPADRQFPDSLCNRRGLRLSRIETALGDCQLPVPTIGRKPLDRFRRSAKLCRRSDKDEGDRCGKLTAPPGLGAPQPLIVRVQSIPARHHFPEHAHAWNQLVYAISGVLTVTVEGSCFVIPSEQAAWLPTGTRHRVGSLLGAEFRSLWVDDEASAGFARDSTVFDVSPLLRALIIEAASIQGEKDHDGYVGRVTHLIIDQLRRAQPLSAALPWPRKGAITALCEALYADPADQRGPDEWGPALGLSARTLSRRFNDEVGMTLSNWRRRLRSIKAIEMLGGGCSVTQTALDLGYGSPSAFIYAFRQEMGMSPQAYRRRRRPFS
jgi:AraC-like DNA-binding protein/mannose-6-phosphate isomerase-like protein (cupin superfamily)